MAEEVVEGGSVTHENRIDISYVTNYLEDSERATLSNNTRKSINEDPVRTKFPANKNRCTTSPTSAEDDNENRLISQIITGVQKASQNDSVLAGGVTRFPTNGIRARVYTENRGSTSSNINKTEERSVVINELV